MNHYWFGFVLLGMGFGLTLGGWFGYWYGRHVEVRKQIAEIEREIAGMKHKP